VSQGYCTPLGTESAGKTKKLSKAMGKYKSSFKQVEYNTDLQE
jgi:hypothetical protein